MRRLSVFLLLLGLVACAPIVKDGQPGTASTQIVLQAGQTVGQTLLARDRGLQGIEIFLRPEPFDRLRATPAGTGEIQLHLRADPQSSTDLAVSALAVQSITAPGWVRFTFPPSSDSRGKDYYLLLELQGDGRVGVGTAPGDTYLEGALYQNESPLDAQMTFRLVYDPRQLFLGFLAQVGSWLGILGVAIFLFILPGWALLALLWPDWDALAWGERLGLAGGMSLALYPLLFLWTDIIGLHLGPLYAWLPALIGLGIILWRYVAGRKVRRLKVQNLQPFDTPYGRRAGSATCNSSTGSLAWPPGQAGRALQLADLTLFAILALIIATRFWVIRSLDVPLWGDSVQHTVMTQLMLDNGGLFKSWVPYAPYNSLTVQFGFSAFASLFAWLTGLGSVKATLIVGQIVNGLAVLALYPLAVRITKGNRWAGIGAVLVAGLLSPMPAFYVNWGRYAQLAGQTVLPVALWLVWEALTPTSSPSPVRKSTEQGRGAAIGLSALALAGMMLIYYRMPFYYATFILALLVGWGLPEWQLNWRIWARKLGILLAVAVLVGLLFLPWALRLVGSNLAGAVEAGVTSGSPVEAVLADYRAWRDLFAYVPELLVFVTLAGLAWSLVRKCWMVAAQGLWAALLSAVIAGGLIRLPGANMMQTFAILIALYIPIGLVFGWMIAEIAGAGNGRIRQSLVAIAVFVVAISGALGQRSIATPTTFAYVTRPDTRAMTWIREHLPGDAHFLVEGYGIYGGTTIVGGDAGWWIPLLAHRLNTMPPQYAILNETPIPPDYTQRMVSLVNRLETISLDSPEGVQLLCGEGVTHIYIGQGQGKVGFSATQLFSPDELLDSQDYSLLYHQDRVYVFALKAGICP